MIKRKKAAPNKYGWSPERRKAQAERIRNIRPWSRSSGPKTAEGKARSRMNAYKSGVRSAPMRDLVRWLRWQKHCVKAVRHNLPIASCPFDTAQLLTILTICVGPHETHDDQIAFASAYLHVRKSG